MTENDQSIEQDSARVMVLGRAIADGTATPAMAHEWLTHRYVCTSEMVRKAADVLWLAIAEKDREITVDNELLAERERILTACPCPVHGACVPHVLAELGRIPELEKELEVKRLVVLEQGALIAQLQGQGNQ